MFDYYNGMSMWSKMELIIDYTSVPRRKDFREVEQFGQVTPIDLIINTNPCMSGMD